VPAPVAAPQPEPDSGSVTFLAAAHDVEVFARSEGVVTVLDVEEGRRVRAGARLAQIEDEAQRFTLQEREAELHSAEAAFQRAQKLHADKMLSEQQFIEARSEYETARARRDRARLDLERCAVRAPFAGVVALRMVQPGQMVKEGALMFRVSDPDTLRAELLLPEEELGRVRVGQRVTLFPRVGGAPAEARVTRVNPVVDAASGTFRVVIDLDNRRAGLPPGISVRCRFEKG
jgi:membrane fusion protein (multidrug efflux system)